MEGWKKKLAVARARVAPTSVQAGEGGGEGKRWPKGERGGEGGGGGGRQLLKVDGGGGGGGGGGRDGGGGGGGGCRWCWRFKGDILNGWFPRRTRGLRYYPMA